jgi:hypothetical protein
LHAALPWVLWGLAHFDDAAPLVLFAALHLAFPVVLVATFRWWRGQGGDIALLVVANHITTFASGGIASWVAG